MSIPGRRYQRNVTLTDIARACGVAPSTVSRALSNPNRVSTGMYERIAHKAKEMGYVSALLPSTEERTARGSIALVLPNLTNPFLYDLIRGSQAQTQAAGFLHILVSTDDSAHVESEWLSDLSRTVDGIIISSPRSPDDVLTAVGDAVPVVVINRDIPGLSSVVIDTAGGAAQALDYLVSLGHSRIAYVRGPELSWTDKNRFEALQAAAARHEVELVPVGAFYPSLSAGAAAADAAVMTKATAAIFFNDTLAIGALSRFRHLGVRIPDEMSVIGCDDIFGAGFSTPPLTTVTAPGERAGRAATELLISLLATKDRAHRTDRLAAHLTVRESTGPAAR